MTELYAETYCMERVPPTMHLCQNKIVLSPDKKGIERTTCSECLTRLKEEKNAGNEGKN